MCTSRYTHDVQHCDGFVKHTRSEHWYKTRVQSWTISLVHLWFRYEYESQHWHLTSTLESLHSDPYSMTPNLRPQQSDPQTLTSTHWTLHVDPYTLTLTLWPNTWPLQSDHYNLTSTLWPLHFDPYNLTSTLWPLQSEP